MTGEEQLGYYLQVGFFFAPTLVGALIGLRFRDRGGAAPGIGAVVGFVLGATGYALYQILG